MKFFSQKSTLGFTLIESMVFLFLFTLISMVFLQTYTVGTRLIIESKNRLGATALANQKMEIIRSIEYDTIGTTTGIPSGDLVEDEDISVNTIQYHVHTFVQYVDDSFDRLVSSVPPDAIPTDYKRVRVTVSWGARGPDQTVAIFGNFSPRGIETAGAGGVLSLNVLDATGTGVSGALLQLTNAAAGVFVNGITDASGNLTFPGAPAGAEAYTLTVSKAGYYGATTFPSYPTTAYNPVDVHASVVAGVLNQKTIVMDRSSDITLTTEDYFGTALPNVSYSLIGGRVLGSAPVTGDPILKFSQAGSTNASGQAVYPAESYGQYNLTITDANYELYALNPESLVQNEFTANAGAATNITAVLLAKNIGSVKVRVENIADNSPLAGASVRLSNALVPYDVVVQTNQYGYAYFPVTLPALPAGDYDIAVSLAGYDNETSTVTIGAVLQSKTIQMTAD